jgi:general stress protein CsbA
MFLLAFEPVERAVTIGAYSAACLSVGASLLSLVFTWRRRDVAATVVCLALFATQPLWIIGFRRADGGYALLLLSILGAVAALMFFVFVILKCKITVQHYLEVLCIAVWILFGASWALERSSANARLLDGGSISQIALALVMAGNDLFLTAGVLTVACVLIVLIVNRRKFGVR